jgi:DNA-binding CsgD family transcriptional regulator
LGPAARELLDAVAIGSRGAEPWLLEQLVDDRAASLDECLGTGMLTASADRVEFRHELARRAIDEALTPSRRTGLHGAALSALEGRDGAAPDPARLAHHAEAAGNSDAVLSHAPEAAKRASSLGAHREAAAQYARALRFADRLAPAERAGLLDGRAYECYLSDQLDIAIEAQEEALACRRAAGSPLEEGDSLRRLAQMYGFAGRATEAADTCHRAVAMLEELEPGRELAMAYGKLAQRYNNWEDRESAIAWGTRALELAERLGDSEITVYALVSVGSAEFPGDWPEGLEKLARALELAQAAGLEDHAGRAFVNLVWLAVRQRAFAIAERYLEAGLEYSGERGLDYWRLVLLACRARLQLDHGRWTEAEETAVQVLGSPRNSPVPGVLAGVALSLVRARRGEAEVWPVLDQALADAEPTGEVQQVGPVAAARAEAAWLEGRNGDAAKAAEATLELALRRSASWPIGELACWRRRAGIDEPTPPGAAEPFALELAGEWARAAEMWEEIGCPYEAALALAGADDDDPLRRALDALQRLGAQPAATIVARRLRERGARGLPRGPRAATRQNPAQLTARELEVLGLVAEGLRNAEIAERLFLSEKTVGHHVSSILRKLDVHTRGEASAEAARLGLVPR